TVAARLHVADARSSSDAPGAHDHGTAGGRGRLCREGSRLGRGEVRPSSRDAGTDHVAFDAKGSPPSSIRARAFMETQRLKTIQVPDHTLGMLESFATTVLGVPPEAHRVNRLAE